MTILYLLQMAFTIWMLVDAVKRRAPPYWYLVAFMPFGPVVYFFAFKIDDYDLGWLKGIGVGPRGPSLDELRRAAQQTPSYDNQIRLARALHDAGAFHDAAAAFEALLERYPNDFDVLFGLGRCRMELGEPDAAIEPLSKLVDRNPGYRDHEGCLELAAAYAKTGRDEEATALLERAVRSSPRLPLQLALARHLVDVHDVERAQVVLRQAIGDHERAPSHVQRRDHGVAREAAAFLKSISPRR